MIPVVHSTEPMRVPDFHHLSAFLPASDHQHSADMSHADEESPRLTPHLEEPTLFIPRERKPLLEVSWSEIEICCGKAINCHAAYI